MAETMQRIRALAASATWPFQSQPSSSIAGATGMAWCWGGRTPADEDEDGLDGGVRLDGGVGGLVHGRHAWAVELSWVALRYGSNYMLHLGHQLHFVSGRLFMVAMRGR